MPRPRYRNYMLIVLMVLYAYNFADRLALGLVAQDIKNDLLLSDTQLGVLNGIAFALLYATMGIPIARWADRGNRVFIIALTTAAWSVMVSMSGLAASYSVLLLCRAGAAIGEAGCVPPAHSLIADYFERAERPRALSVHMLGGSVSVLIGYFACGWLNQLYGWRQMFVMLGIPGIALAILARLTLKEPRLLKDSHIIAPSAINTSELAQSELRLSEIAATFWRNRTFRHLTLCFVIAMFFNFASLQWQAAFFMRSFGLRSGELGTWFALISASGGVAGTYFGGLWATRRAANDEARQLRIVGISYCAYGLASALMYLSPNRYLAYFAALLMALSGGLSTGPLFATIQTLVPARARATAIAVMYLFANLIGLGLGPLVTGMISDALITDYGNASLRYALLLLCPGFVWSAWHAWRASETVASDSIPATVTVQHD